MIDLMGQYSYKVDAKGRVALPPKFAKELSKELIVTLNPDKTCLLLFEPEGFNEWVKRWRFPAIQSAPRENQKCVERPCKRN